jgi:hypothetical protein
LLAKISVPFSKETLKMFEKRPTENLEAYQAYLEGRYFWNNGKDREERLAKGR